MLPSRRKLNFYKIAVFDLDAKTHRKSREKYTDSEVKIQENFNGIGKAGRGVIQDSSRDYQSWRIVAMRFLRFLEGFWEAKSSKHDRKIIKNGVLNKGLKRDWICNVLYAKTHIVLKCWNLKNRAPVEARAQFLQNRCFWFGC